MTETGPTGARGPAKEPAAGVEAQSSSFRLRPLRPPVKRLSRMVLTSGTAIFGVVIAGALLWGLRQNGQRPTAAEELHITDHLKVADGLAGLPRDYAGVPRDVPRLGPPLPGDLGRPIVAAQTQAGPLVMDPEQQRMSQESEAARISKVFASANVRTPSIAAPATEVTPNASASADEAFTQNGQDRKLAFFNASTDRRTTNADRVTKPASRYVVQAGSVVSAALITGLRSDLPGQIMAHVTEPLYDSPSGQILLVPQGSRLIGVYDSQVAFGQSRVLLVWTRLIMPNGRSIILERQPGADAGGYAGLQDRVDHRWGDVFQAALLSTMLGVGVELGMGVDAGSGSGPVLQALRRGAGEALNQTGQQVVRRNLNIQPTLTIRPGFPVRVIVNRDLVLEPYKA